MNAQPCAWCEKPIVRRRRDAKYCSKSCRQAAWRARIRHSDLVRATQALRLAYADPPYPGKSDLYRDQPSYAGEVDIPALLSRLATYDGWALSTSAAALPQVLAECVSRRLPVHVAPWVKQPRPHKSARILNAWEAVIYSPARGIIPQRDPGDTSPGTRATRPKGSRSDTSKPPLQVIDTLVGVNPRRRPTLPGNCIGMKPPAFCEWIFRLLAGLPGDTLEDLFPGSGIVTRCWHDYTGQPPPGARKDFSPSKLLTGEPK
jgi:hypothetical protein